jgi:ribosomal-protein-alanine N-acetyltransferase
MNSKGFAGIRPIEAGDSEPLEHFFENNNRPEVLRQFNPFPLSPEVARKIALDHSLDHYYVLISRSGEVAGLCMLRGWNEGFDIPSFGVIVDIQYRRLGLGRTMTEFAIAEARRLHADWLRLSVNESNRYAKSLYESLGFNEVSKEPVIINGEPDIKIVMIRELTH